MDRLRALEIFIEVAEAASLAGAARKLSLSAPTVTRVLSEFEQQLGVLLFHRTTRAVTLTGPGQTFLEDARRIVRDYHDASDAVRGLHREPAGLLRITAPILFGQYYILPILTQFMDRYPAVKVDAVFLDRTVNLVEEGFDLALRIGELPDSNMIATHVGNVHRVVCGHPNYLKKHGVPKTPQDLVKHRIISVRPLAPSNDWHFRGNVTVSVNPSLHISSVPAAIDAAKSGWGLTQVLSYQVGPSIADNSLTSVLSEYEPEVIPVHLVHAEGRAASAKVRGFVDMARPILRGDHFLNP